MPTEGQYGKNRAAICDRLRGNIAKLLELVRRDQLIEPKHRACGGAISDLQVDE